MRIDDNTINRVVEIARSYGAKRLILFGGALENPESVRDLDLACDGVEGWKLYELGAMLENELQIPFDLVPLSPSTRFTRYIEYKGRRLI